jgi:hypothetical protein
MAEIQTVMSKLTALESVEKPFKQVASIVGQIEETKLEIEIHLEELGKLIRGLDEISVVLTDDLVDEMDELRSMFQDEDGKAFDFQFEKFSLDELMVLMRYDKKFFPSRMSQFEEYWKARVRDLDQRNGALAENHSLELETPLKVREAQADVMDLVLETEDSEDLSADVAEEQPIDHGVQDLSDFGRQFNILEQRQEDRRRLIEDADLEGVEGLEEMSGSMPVPPDSHESLDMNASETDEEALSASEIASYEQEVGAAEEPFDTSFDGSSSSHTESIFQEQEAESQELSEEVDSGEAFLQSTGFQESEQPMEPEYSADSMAMEETHDGQVQPAEEVYEDAYSDPVQEQEVDPYAEDSYQEGYEQPAYDDGYEQPAYDDGYEQQEVAQTDSEAYVEPGTEEYQEYEAGTYSDEQAVDYSAEDDPGLAPLDQDQYMDPPQGEYAAQEEYVQQEPGVEDYQDYGQDQPYDESVSQEYGDEYAAPSDSLESDGAELPQAGEFGEASDEFGDGSADLPDYGDLEEPVSLDDISIGDSEEVQDYGDDLEISMDVEDTPISLGEEATEVGAPLEDEDLSINLDDIEIDDDLDSDSGGTGIALSLDTQMELPVDEEEDVQEIDLDAIEINLDDEDLS